LFPLSKGEGVRGRGMRAVIQRVSKASVAIENKMVAQINHGLLILLGIENQDTDEDINWLVAKISKLRIFADNTGAMNCSVIDTNGDILIVSQFTLHASTKKGNRPSFIKAAKPDVAIPLYELFVSTFEKELGKPISTGEFGAMMEVLLVNDGPVTIVIDTKNKE
tara:strand:- start:4446 stop:4940 length:495 start_codon:yes stop_codon:yes gene_type:complete